jgi:hypothetical protein
MDAQASGAKMKTKIKNKSRLWKSLLVMLSASGLMLSNSWANDVYIEQIGDNSTVSITQTGAGNLVNGNVDGSGNTDDPALIKGDLNSVTITQIGASNTVSVVVNNETNGTGATVVISADGSGNNQTVGCGTALASNCNANTIRSEIVGNNKLRIFPIPTNNFKLWIDYYLEKDKNITNFYSGSRYEYVSDPSDIPYEYCKYCKINQPGKQWIKKYFSAKKYRPKK